MVEIETVDELADAIADMLGVYGAGPEYGSHDDECDCRNCFVIRMEDRIRNAVKNDKLLNNG